MENKDQNDTLSTLGEGGVRTPPSSGVVQPPATMGALSLEQPAEAPLIPEQPKGHTRRFLRTTGPITVVLALLLIAIVTTVSIFVARNSSKEPETANNKFSTVKLPLSELISGQDLSISQSSNVTINGTLQLSSGLLVAPSLQPTGAKPGQIYYDQGTNQLAYYNGSNFVFLTGPEPTQGGVQSLGGATGQLAIGSGLGLNSNQLSNDGVLTVQGQAGSVTLTAGPGILINGTNFSNSGVLSVAAGTPNVTVVNDGNGGVTISVASPLAGTGTVTSGGGTAGKIPVFTTTQNIEDSIITQAGLGITIGGDLTVTGNLNLSTPLTVSQGGTGTNLLNANGVLIGNGGSTINSVVAGGAGLCLMSTAGAPVWGVCPGGGGGGVASLNGLVGALTLSNASAAGSTITIDDATGATKGIASFDAANLTVTAGVVTTVQNISTGASPTFATINTSGVNPSGTLLTVGSSAAQLLLQGDATTALKAFNGANSTTVSFQSPTASVAYRFATAAAGSYDVCTSVGNCTGVGGGVSTSGGTTNRLAKFSGAQAINDSTLTDDGTNVTTSVDMIVQGGDLTIGVPTAQTGTINLANNGSGFLGSIIQGALSANHTYTLPDASGTICLSSGNCPSSGVTSLNSLTGAVTIANATAAGSTVTINDASTSAKGIASFNATNFTVTSGAVNTVQNINTTATPTFAGVNTNTITPSGALTVGVTGQTLTLQGSAATQLVASSGASATTVSFQSPTANVTYRFLTATAGSYDICTTVGNCTGVGGGVTTSGGTANRLAKFSSGQAIADSSLTDDGTNVLTSIDMVIQGGDLTVGVPSTQTGTINLANNGSGFLGSIVQGALSANRTYTLPDASGTVCLSSGNCPNGGVTSLNSLVGALNIANASATGSTITIDNATSSAKGIASFNATNFTVTSGAVNTIQDISTSASPTFAAINTGTINPSGTLNVSGNIDASGTLSVGTGNAFQVAANGDITTSGAATVNGASVTIGSASQAGSLILNDGATKTGTLNVTTLGQNTIYTLPDPGVASVSICLTSGNCTGTGGGVTTSGGTTNRIAKFSGSQVLADSSISDNGTNVSTTGDLIIQGGDVTVGVASSQTGSIHLAHSGSAFTGTMLQGALTADRTYTLPDASGTICLTSGNCSGSGSSSTLQAAYDAGNTIASTDGRDIAFTLANTTTDANLTVDIATGSTSSIAFRRANGAGTADPAQLLLLDNLDTDRAQPTGLRIQSAGGGMTTAIDVSDPEIVTALSVGDNGVSGGVGNITYTNFSIAGATGTITTKGSAIFANTTNSNTTTLNAGVPTANRNLTLPDESGTLCVQNSTNCGFAATSGSGNYIQNTTTPQTANIAVQSAANGNVSLLIKQLGSQTADLLRVTDSNNVSLFGVDAFGSFYQQNKSTLLGEVGIGMGASSGQQLRITVGGPASTGITLYGNASQTADLVQVYGSGTRSLIYNAAGTLSLAAGSGQSADLFTLQNTSGAVLSSFASNGQLTLGRVAASGTTQAGSLRFADGTNDNFATTINTTTLSNNRTITLPDESGTLCVQNSTNCGFAATSGSTNYIHNQTTVQAANMYIQAATTGTVAAKFQAFNGGTGDIVDYLNGTGTTVGSISSSGSVLFKPSTDSTTAFQVQSSGSATPLLNVDTSTSNISLLGNNSPTLSAWATTTAMSVGTNTTRVRGGSIAANGYLYQIGGVDGTATTLATVQYAKLNADGTVGTWASTTALPGSRRQFQPVVVNGYLYIIGGRDNSNTIQSTSYYAKLNNDGTVGTWNTTTALTSGAAARFGQGTVAYNGYMYVVGGFNSSVTATNTVYSARINPDGTLGTWGSTSTLPTINANINGTIVANGYIYVPGGFSAGSDTDSVFYAKLNADGTIGSWTNQTAVIPGGGDENFESYVSNGYLYLVGGDFGGRVTAFQLGATGALGTAVSLTNFPLNPIGEASSAMANGYLYVLGGSSGSDGSGTVRNTVYYASTSRVKVGGNLDLVGYSGKNLAEGDSGGQLTAGNTTIVGTLQVQDTATFARGVSVGDSLRVAGAASFTNAANSTTAFQVQNAAGTSILTVDTTNSLVTVASLTVSGTLTVNGHIVSGGSTPTFSAGTAACTTPTISVTGTDTAGIISITTGTGCAASGKMATINFASAFASAPRVVLTAAESNAAKKSYYIDSATTTTAGFDVDVTVANTDATVYKWYYQVIQ